MTFTAPPPPDATPAAPARESPYYAKQTERRNAEAIRIVDIDVPFGSMFALVLKFTLASIPAAIVIFVLGFMVSLIFGSLVGSFYGR